jgi:crotonobetainyl-CoA hydratase
MTGDHQDSRPKDGNEPPVLFERHGRVALVTFNRPAVLNAISYEMSVRCGEIIEQIAQDDDLWVIVLTGAGDRSFSVGADLRDVARRKPGEPAPKPPFGFAGITRHFVDKPVIAAVNGYAHGGGLEVVLACDLAVASSRATFALAEVKRGFAAGGGGLVRLQRQVPVKVALEMAMTGEPIDAETALRHGLVNEVVGHEATVARALALAGRIAGNAPLAVRACKRTIYRSLEAPLHGVATAWDINELERQVVTASDDAREGPRAFVEKRTPVWTGR